MSRIALTDFETTGLMPGHHEIVEIACVVFDEDTFQIEKTFERKVWPQHPDRLDAKAQKVNGYNAAEWRAGGAVPLETALKEYAAFTKGCLFMAYNVAFDAGFLNAAIAKSGVKVELARPYLCLLTMAYDHLHARPPRSWRMADVCRHLDIPPEPAQHRAMNGVMAEYEIYKALAS